MLRKLIIAFVCIFVLANVSMYAIVNYLEHSAIFYPGKGIDLTPESEGLNFEDLYIKTPDGLLINGWFIKSTPTAATILYSHGNEGNMDDGDRMEEVKFFHDLGLNVLTFDYRGYGRSQGIPSEEGVYKDALGAYDYLQTRSDIDPKRIIAFGASLGGAVAIDLATKRKIIGLIIDSSFTCAKDMAEIMYPYLPSWMMSVKFDNVSKVKNLTMPKFFMHSSQDEIIEREIGENLFKAANTPKQFLVTSGRHDDGQFMRVLSTKAQFINFLKKNNFIDSPKETTGYAP